MMAAISIDRHVVCAEHDFNGMTLEYFWNFLLNEYIPAYRDELTDEDIQQIHKGIEEKKDHIYVSEIVNPKNGKRRFKHSFVYANPFMFWGEHPKYEFDGF